MLFILMFVTLWTISFVIWRHARGVDYARLVALMFIAGGCASFSVSIHHVILPFLRQHTEVAFPLLEAGRILGTAALHVYYYFIYYLFLMGALIISGLFTKRMLLWLGLASILTPLWSLAAQTSYYPVTVVEVQSIRTWSFIYVLAGISCYVIGYIREPEPLQKRNILRSGLLINIALVLAFITDFYSVAVVTIDESDILFANGNHWDANSLIVLWILLLFVLFALRYGVFGVKLRIEQQKLDYSIRALTKGTAILNHALKNEVVKINLIGEHIQYLLEHGEKESAQETVSHLFQITDRMTALFRKIGDQTEEIILKKEPVRVNRLIDSIAAQLQPLAESKGVTIRCSYQCDVNLMCDPHHLAEVLNNLCLNAMEAISSDRGSIEISTMMRGGRLAITVKDDGQGIPKEMVSHVFTPFFSTKSSHAVHSGLGLSYCYNVLRKHGGSIKVLASDVNKGTLIGLSLPLKE